MRSNILYRLEYQAVLFARWITAPLSDNAKVAAGGLVGKLTRVFIPSMAKRIRANLKRAYPALNPAQVEELVDKNLSHMGRIALEFVSAGKLTEDEIRSRVRVEGLELLKEALSGGRGALILSGHLGNWEYGGLRLSVEGYPLSGIARALHNPYVDKFIIATRKRFGAKIIEQKGAAKPALKTLKAGGLVFLLLDQRATGDEWVSSTFFDQPVATNKGLAILSIRSGAPVVFTTCLTEGTGYVLKFHQILQPPEETMERAERIVRYTRIFDEVLEKVMRERPHEWFWVHKRWQLPKEFKA